MSNTNDGIKERGQALEDAFFRQEDAKKIEKLRIRDVRAELTKVSGITDDAMLDRLLALGVTPTTITAIALVPLIEVAWCDGEVHINERTAVLKSAEASGVGSDSASHTLLEKWLTERPDKGLRD